MDDGNSSRFRAEVDVIKAGIRWMAWGMILGAGALIGIALAGSDGPDGELTPDQLVKRLSHPDWKVRTHATEALRNGGEDAYKALFSVKDPTPEARFRIALLKKELAPLYGHWKHALQAGREAIDAGHMAPALKYFFIAAEKNENLRNDGWIACLCRKAWADLDSGQRAVTSRADWELYLAGEYAYLADHFPQSEYREVALFKAGKYGDVIAEYPDGTYAPLAKYSITAGHDYYEPPQYLEITDPESEVEKWPRFLREHPGHPGCDDAAYRMGRALEALGRNREAVIWLMRSARLPDGEFSWKGPLRALYVMDAVASETDLAQLASGGTADDLGETACLTMALRRMRKRDFDKALDGFKAFLTRFPKSKHAEAVKQKIHDLTTILIPRSKDVAAGKDADLALYELGRYFYHRLLALYNPMWENNRVNYFSYEVNCLGRSHAFDHPSYFEEHNNYLQAASYFDELWKTYPQSTKRAAALYSAGTAYMKAMKLNLFSRFPKPRKVYLEASEARYRQVVTEHPESTLADDARTLISIVRKLPTDGRD